MWVGWGGGGGGVETKTNPVSNRQEQRDLGVQNTDAFTNEMGEGGRGVEEEEVV